MLYDISPTLSASTPVYPGDQPFTLTATAALAAGAEANVSALTTTTHVGAHVDAPLHTEAGARAIADLPLEIFLGPCRVLAVPAAELIEPEHLADLGIGDPPRLLLKTSSVEECGRFPAAFTAISPAGAELLATRGLLLVGLDTPSVDPPGSTSLPAHHILAGRGVVLLEGVVLESVPPGLYELIALPLKLAGGDASPVRAVLRSLPRADT